MAGGVERMIVTIMNEMVRRGHDVALFTWDPVDAVAFYSIDPSIDWYRLNMGDPSQKAGFSARIKRAPQVRKLVLEFSPDVIVCFQGGPFKALLAYTLGLGIPIVAAERTSPSLYEFVGRGMRAKRREHFLFRFASKITVQFDRYRTAYPQTLQSLIVETPNPVAQANLQAAPEQANEKGRYTLLSVGRLSFQKNYEVLLKAFERIAHDFPDWDLLVLGEGEDREKLQTLIEGSDVLLGRVNIPGAVSDVSKYYAHAHLFCLPSRWEGFPNALAEALAHGLPSVGFAECDGVADLVAPGRTGLTAEGNNNAETLSLVLAELMADPSKRIKMGETARASMQKYRPEKCFDRWEEVLLTQSRSKTNRP